MLASLLSGWTGAAAAATSDEVAAPQVNHYSLWFEHNLHFCFPGLDWSAAWGLAVWLGGAQNNPPVEPRGGGPADPVGPQILEAESMVGTRALKELPILVPKIQEELPNQILEAGSMAGTRELNNSP